MLIFVVMQYRIKHTLFFVFLLTSFLITAIRAEGQSNINIKFQSLSATLPSTEYKVLFENNLDADGYWVFQPGALISYEFFILELDHSIRIQQGIFTDIAAQPALYSHIGYRNRLFKFWRHTLNFGFGPTLYYRQSWKRFNEYQDHGDLIEYNDWEYKLIPLGFELEYDFYISNRNDVSLALLYMQPKTVSLAIGYKFWFQTKIKHKKKCNTCYYQRH